MNKLFTILWILSTVYGYTQNTCTTLTSPQNGETGVPLDTSINWTAVAGVNGYLLSIGTTPGGTDILDNEMVGSVTTYTPQTGLPEQTTIYITLSLFYFDAPSVPCAEESFTTVAVTDVPECTSLSDPPDGATGIEVTPSVSWNYAYGASGYIITAGSAPGLDDYLNAVDVGNTLTYNFTNALPAETTIYLEITPYNRFGVTENCTITSFTTRPEGSVPGCTFLTSPIDGETNVDLTTRVYWLPEPDATGYIVNMGYSPGVFDILDNAVFTDPEASVLDFVPNSVVYVTITPFNDAGEAVGCQSESFTTSLGCGPYTDPVTGELVNLNPVIDIPDTLAVCDQEVITPFQDLDPDLQYTWYLLEENQTLLLGEDPVIEILEPGNYLVEVTDTLLQEGNILECSARKTFTVIFAEPPELTRVDFTEVPAGIRIAFEVTGDGDYEYALNDPSGPFSQNTVFEVPEQESYTLYINESRACGITSFELEPISFPNFFTPNGDGINDTWKPTVIGASRPDLLVVHIFDRYGKRVKSISSNDPGWNGEYNGRPLPASDYWYRAEFDDGSLKKGHFSLKR